MLFRKLITVGGLDLFYDEFTVNQDPIVSPRTTTGGQGANVTDSAGVVKIENQRMFVGENQSGAPTDPRYASDDAYPHVAGSAGAFTIETLSTTFRVAFRVVPFGFRHRNGGAIESYNGSDRSRSIEILDKDTPATIASIFRDEGGTYVVSNSRGSWVLAIPSIEQISIAGEGEIEIENDGSSAGQGLDVWVDSIKFTAPLPAPFNQNYGLTTYRDSGSIGVESFAHEPDFFIQLTLTTLPSSGQIEINFREQDASNYWYIAITSAGVGELYEVVSGVPTMRGSGSGISSGNEILIGGYDARSSIYFWANTIKPFRYELLIAYTSAINFSTETSGQIATLGTGGALDDLRIFKSDLSEYAAILDGLVSDD